MRLTIEIDTDNDAFQEAGEEEVRRILAGAAEAVGAGDLPAQDGAELPLRDINGNRVGSARWEA